MVYCHTLLNVARRGTGLSQTLIGPLAQHFAEANVVRQG
jgi:hypothetical protein